MKNVGLGRESSVGEFELRVGAFTTLPRGRRAGSNARRRRRRRLRSRSAGTMRWGPSGAERSGSREWGEAGLLLAVSATAAGSGGEAERLLGRDGSPAARETAELLIVEAEALELLLIDRLDQLGVDGREDGVFLGELLVEVQHVLFALLQDKKIKGCEKAATEIKFGSYDLGSEGRLDLPVLEVVPLDRPEEAVVLDGLLRAVRRHAAQPLGRVLLHELQEENKRESI